MVLGRLYFWFGDLLYPLVLYQGTTLPYLQCENGRNQERLNRSHTRKKPKRKEGPGGSGNDKYDK
jgi:hypothetical protein